MSEKSLFDKAYDKGYRKGREDSVPVKAGLTRLAYLEMGGEWHRETTGDLYVQGFKDALKTLGVLK